MTVPHIETDRLILRGHELRDFPHARALWADPVVTRFIGGRPSTEQQTWSRLLAYVGHWCLTDFGYWAIEEKASGQFIGEVGFADFKRDIDPAMRDAPELGWALAAAFHNKGYGTEGVLAAVTWADAHLPARTVCLIDPGNTASLRVAEKCGYRAFKRATFNERATTYFERSRGARAHT